MVILLVESEVSFRKTLGLLLKAEHDVTFIADGPKALLFLPRNPVDLVITGENLPFVSGLELIRRGKEMCPKTAFFLFSNSNPEKSGADHVFSVPFDVSDFKDRIESLRKKKEPPTRVRALPAREPAAEETGVSQLRRFLAMTRTTKESLAKAEALLTSLPDSVCTQLIELGQDQLQGKLEIPKVLNNFLHVEEQLLHPVIEDEDFLLEAFGTASIKLQLLVVLHDLGKVEFPGNLFAFLQEVFPHDFVAREVLTHEFASMHWIAELGKMLKLSSEIVWALQTLIANHNFGPDLCDSKNQHLQNNWWPMHFRTKVLPALRERGFDLNEFFSADSRGEFQYNHTEGSCYASLLAAYDRAIATKFNNYGVATWQKFSEQNYTAWRTSLAKDPTAPNPLQSVGLTKKMEMAAQWAQSEIEAIWEVLAREHAKPGFDLSKFPPYLKQKEGVEKLLGVIKEVKGSNVPEASGRLLYHTKDRSLYRVDDQGPADKKAKLYWWENSTNRWAFVATDRSPIRLFFEIIRGDL